MRGCDESKLIDTETIRDNAEIYAERLFLDTKKNPKKGIKSFFLPKFKVYLPKDQRGVLLNSIQLQNYRNKIIGLFENRNISPSMHALNAKSEQEKYDGAKKSEEIFDEIIGERVKLRSQKSDGFNKMITEKDEIINRDLSKEYLQFQSLSHMQEELSKTQNAQENKALLHEINNEIINLNRNKIKCLKMKMEKQMK